MSTVVNEVLTANQRYASNFGNKGNLPMPPGRYFAILTCMDARLDPAQYTGLAEGDAHVIRNAGGHASDDASRASTPAAGTMRAAVDHPKASTSAGSPFPIRSRVCSKTCTHPRPSVDTRKHPHLRLHLRREEQQTGRGVGRHYGGPGAIAAVGGGGWHSFRASPHAGRIVWGQRAPLTRPPQEPPQAHHFLIAVPPGRSRRFPQRARACLPAGDHPSAA